MPLKPESLTSSTVSPMLHGVAVAGGRVRGRTRGRDQQPMLQLLLLPPPNHRAKAAAPREAPLPSPPHQLNSLPEQLADAYADRRVGHHIPLHHLQTAPKGLIVHLLGQGVPHGGWQGRRHSERVRKGGGQARCWSLGGLQRVAAHSTTLERCNVGGRGGRWAKRSAGDAVAAVMRFWVCSPAPPGDATIACTLP